LDYVGRTIATLGRQRNADPIDVVCDCLIEDKAATRVLVTSISQDDPRRRKPEKKRFAVRAQIIWAKERSMRTVRRETWDSFTVTPNRRRHHAALRFARMDTSLQSYVLDDPCSDVD
jgi:hypothetical protein